MCGAETINKPRRKCGLSSKPGGKRRGWGIGRGLRTAAWRRQRPQAAQGPAGSGLVPEGHRARGLGFILRAVMTPGNFKQGCIRFMPTVWPRTEGANGWPGCIEDGQGRAGGGGVFRGLRGCPAPGRLLGGVCRLLSVPCSLLSLGPVVGVGVCPAPTLFLGALALEWGGEDSALLWPSCPQPKRCVWGKIS